VIVAANTTDRMLAAKGILRNQAGVVPTPDLQALMWVNPTTTEIEWVVGFDGFVGKCCQMHVVNLSGSPTPRKYLWACFDYPFNQAGMEFVTGIVNSNNKEAMRFDKHLGFTELARLPGAHDEGGDLVVMKMHKSECRWLKLGKRYETELLAA